MKIEGKHYLVYENELRKEEFKDCLEEKQLKINLKTSNGKASAELLSHFGYAFDVKVIVDICTNFAEDVPAFFLTSGDDKMGREDPKSFPNPEDDQRHQELRERQRDKGLTAIEVNSIYPFCKIIGCSLNIDICTPAIDVECEALVIVSYKIPKKGTPAI